MKIRNKSLIIIIAILALSFLVKLNTHLLKTDYYNWNKYGNSKEVMEKIETSETLLSNFIEKGDKIDLIKTYGNLRESVNLFINTENEPGVNSVRENEYYEYFILSILKEIEDNYSNEDKEYWEDFHRSLSDFLLFSKRNSNDYKKPYISKLIENGEIDNFGIFDLKELEEYHKSVNE